MLAVGLGGKISSEKTIIQGSGCVEDFNTGSRLRGFDSSHFRPGVADVG